MIIKCIKIINHRIELVIVALLRWMNITNMRLRKVQYGERFKVNGLIYFRGTGRIVIGKDVTVNSCMEANPIGGDTKTIFFTKGNGNIEIGNNVGISNSAIVAFNNITIEDDVLIGGGCKVYDSDFHSLDYLTRLMSGCIEGTSKPVRIKKGAFIGAHSIILKGVTIGSESIIGAGSVVTKDVPDGEIWAGNPAIFIRRIVE